MGKQWRGPVMTQTKLHVRVECSCGGRGYTRYVDQLDQAVEPFLRWRDKGCHDNPGHNLTTQVREATWRRSGERVTEFRNLVQLHAHKATGRG